MAIYHLTHRTVGKTTHAAGTAGAHLGYITRASACRAVISEHIPHAAAGSKGGAARNWMDAAEAADRKNARVIDKFEIALPLELDEAQRLEAVRAFVREFSGGKSVPFFAALHDKPGTKDAANPHAHVVIRDRDPASGKGRVIGTSEKGSTERAREVWEQVCNEALRDAGKLARVDRRSLTDQGITDRKPSGHEGPQPRAMERRGKPSEKLARLRATRKGPERPTEARRAPSEALKRVQTRKSQAEHLNPAESLYRHGNREAAALLRLLDEKARRIWREVGNKVEARKMLVREARRYLDVISLPDAVADQIADLSAVVFRRPPKEPMPLRNPAPANLQGGAKAPLSPPARPVRNSGFRV